MEQRGSLLCGEGAVEVGRGWEAEQEQLLGGMASDEDRLGGEVAVVESSGQEGGVSLQGKCCHSRQSNRDQIGDSQGQGHPRTSRWTCGGGTDGGGEVALVDKTTGCGRAGLVQGDEGA